MRQLRRALSIATLALAAMLGGTSASRGDGTVLFDSGIMPLLEQRPVFADFLLSTLEFSRQASGVTIGADVNPRLGSTRVGPYSVLAKRKGDPGTYTMDVVINTDQHYYAADGKETDDIGKAASVRESFASVEINPLGGR